MIARVGADTDPPRTEEDLYRAPPVTLGVNGEVAEIDVRTGRRRMRHALEHRPQTKEPGYDRARRGLCQLLGRADLGKPARVEHGDAVGDGAHLVQVVADVDGGRPRLALDAAKLAEDLLPRIEVEGTHRLIEQ